MKRLLLALLLLALPAQASEFSADEIALIESLGPWPPAFEADPGNRLSGRMEAVRLGAALFTEARLSGNGTVSCAGCHRPERAWSDGKPVGEGLVQLDRNTPGLWDVRLQRWFGWDGGRDSLWSSSIRPILAPKEMGGSIARTAAVIRGDAGLARCFAAATGQDAARLPDEDVLVLAAKALAAFQETLVSGRTAFDDLRDALVAGRSSDYPDAAKRGLKLFVGRGNCVFCHSGPGFSNGEFHDTGLPFFMASGRPDPGRHDGIRQARTDAYNRLSRFSDDATGASAFAIRHVAQEHRNWGEFKVPGLRNLRFTAPYMHDGSKATLHDVIRHYSDLDEERLHSDGEAILRPLGLSEGEIDDLVAFLDSLGSEAGQNGSQMLSNGCRAG